MLYIYIFFKPEHTTNTEVKPTYKQCGTHIHVYQNHPAETNQRKHERAAISLIYNIKDILLKILSY